MARSELNNTGDYSISKLELVPQHGTGTPVAIHQVMVEMHIFEDINKPFLTGTLAITDGVGLVSKLPIVGEEHLNVTIETPGADTIEHTFYVYKISDRINTGDNLQTYMLNFGSLEMLKNTQTSTSYGFNGELISDMVQKIYDDFLAIDKPIDIEPTLNPRRMVFPNWAPSRILLEMTKTAQSATWTEGADYKFWEGIDGFHFRSIQSLIEEIEPIKDSEQRERLHWSIQNTIDNVSANTAAIQEFRIANTVNNMRKVIDGTFGSRLLSFDPVAGGLTVIEKKLDDVWETFSSMEPNKPVGALSTDNLQIPDANIRLLLTDAAEEFASGIENFVQTARTQRGLIESGKVEVKLPGSTARKIGNMVELRLPQTGPREAEGHNLDRQLSSNAMIASINHGFTRTKYSQVIKLIKDSSVEEVATDA